MRAMMTKAALLLIASSPLAADFLINTAANFLGVLQEHVEDIAGIRNIIVRRQRQLEKIAEKLIERFDCHFGHAIRL